MPDRYITIEELKQEAKEGRFKLLIAYCDGGSLFGWLIRVIDKSKASHMQFIRVRSDGLPEIVTQHITLRTYPIEHMSSYNTKLIWNPDWTDDEIQIMNEAIDARLALPWWKRLYDIRGVIGEALNWEWLQSQARDFCSEFVARVLALVDLVFRAWMKGRCPSPTPREVNLYTKSHNPPYEVYGRYSPDDEEKAHDGTRTIKFRKGDLK